jgi:hypothetical protein
MEVNLAIFIMAVGLLAMVALYPLAYRENQQSKDDVKAAAAADCILNTLTAALSSRYVQWKDWQKGIEEAIGETNKGDEFHQGWLSYCDWKESGNEGTFVAKKRGTINSTAKRVFGKLAGVNRDKTLQWPLGNNDELAYAIVARWGEMPVYDSNLQHMTTKDDYSRVAIGVRVARRSGELLSQPIFYTEVHFQGDQQGLKE